MAVLGPRFCARVFSSCGKGGPLFSAVRGPPTIAAPPVAEHRLQTRRLSSCGSRAQLLRGMWDPPRPGHEPASPALAGRLPTTVPPGKPRASAFEETPDQGQRERGRRKGGDPVMHALNSGLPSSPVLSTSLKKKKKRIRAHVSLLTFLILITGVI